MPNPFFSVFTQEQNVIWREEDDKLYKEVESKPEKSKVPLISPVIAFFKRLFKPNEDKRRLKSAFLANTNTSVAIPHPMLKRKNQTFNHVYSFYLDEQNRVWFALRDDSSKAPNWRPMYFDGLPNDPECDYQILADGQNLMVRVTKGDISTIHYKKVIKDKRVKVGKDQYQYQATGIVEQLKSIKDWFSLPILKLFKPDQLGKRLEIPAQAKFAMAHTGQYKHHYKDRNDKTFKIWGVTSGYQIIDGKILLHDPFVSEDSKVMFDLPNTNQSELEVLEIDASGSTLLIYGIETKIDKHGVAIKEPVLYTRLLDYDAMGFNPLQIKSFDPDSGRRTVPMGGWVKHVLPKAKLTNCFNVIQTGIDYNTGELRIEGEQDGVNGFYYKNLNDRLWHFHQMNQPILEQDFISTAPELSDTACDLKGFDFQPTSQQAIEINGVKFSHMVCENYQPLATQVDITLYDEDDHAVDFALVRKKNMLKAFVGLESETWHLVLKDNSFNYKHIFKGNASMPVELGHIDGEPSALVIQSKSPKTNFQVNVPMKTYRGKAYEPEGNHQILKQNKDTTGNRKKANQKRNKAIIFGKSMIERLSKSIKNKPNKIQTIPKQETTAQKKKRHSV